MSAPNKEEEDINFADEGGETLPDTVAPLVADDIPKEQRYLRTQAYDKSISDVVAMIESDDIVLDPEYQRNYVWDNKKASLLVESILLNVPIPVIYVAGKFESFAESIIKEFIFKINEIGLSSDLIPDTLRLQHTFYALQVLETVRQRHKHPEAKTLFCKLGKLWASSENFTTLEIDANLSFGKHGEGELCKLFERIGILDIFETIKLTEKIETVATESPVDEPIDFKGIFNSVTAMRNNILHEDASPNLNTEQIRKFRRYFENFAIELDLYLGRILPKPNAAVN